MTYFLLSGVAFPVGDLTAVGRFIKGKAEIVAALPSRQLAERFGIIGIRIGITNGYQRHIFGADQAVVEKALPITTIALGRRDFFRACL